MGFAAIAAAGLAYRFAATKNALKIELQEKAGEMKTEFHEKADDIKDEMGKQIEGLRRDVITSYLPAQVAHEQRESELFRLQNIETELRGFRERFHQVANSLSTLNLSMVELANVRDRLSDLSERISENSRRITNLEGRGQNWERNKGQ